MDIFDGNSGSSVPKPGYFQKFVGNFFLEWATTTKHSINQRSIQMVKIGLNNQARIQKVKERKAERQQRNEQEKARKKELREQKLARHEPKPKTYTVGFGSSKPLAVINLLQRRERTERTERTEQSAEKVADLVMMSSTMLIETTAFQFVRWIPRGLAYCVSSVGAQPDPHPKPSGKRLAIGLKVQIKHSNQQECQIRAC
eukprot:TRINITY_DN897_c1_g1_i3.p2 TRINITY_DN897_c1_g1~~TRINITY_DN897_c1_g1_i3.p2  ORF type:complete len:200 (+),score=9.92 TRINITY_DN897_c1_g1_i3:149-748(+)